MGGAFSLYPNHIFLSEKEHKGQRFTPKKRTVPVSCFESGIDHIVYQLCGLTKKTSDIVNRDGFSESNFNYSE